MSQVARITAVWKGRNGLICLLAALTLAGGSACARATAKARTDPAPLAIPQPPPRLIEPLPEVEEFPTVEPERRETPPPPPRTTKPRDNGAPRSEPKADPKPPETAPPAEVPPVPPPPAPRAELRIPEVADEDKAARKVRDTIASAKKTLEKVDYQTLGKEGQEQYNTAKRFMDQADEAMKARNHIAAQYLADKAETLAKGLTGR